jgi:phosphoglucosamine mutase
MQMGTGALTKLLILGHMKKQYFGTDGIRGRVGTPPITADFVVHLGRALGAVLANNGRRPRVLIGKDTRISGYMLESALEAGLISAGAEVVLTGPMTTPAIAYLTRTQGADAGIVISASHNPFADNGIKFFDGAGEKLSDDLELAIEAELAQPFATVEPEKLGKAVRLNDAAGRYIEFCKSTIARPYTKLRGRRIVLDCANGAGYQVAPRVFQELGFDVIAVAVQPDGININAGCGATDLALLKREVVARGAWLGIALDGDGDRLMLVDHSGRVFDGDDVVLLLAMHLHSQGQLRGPVVGTVMTNLGIELALKEKGIAFARAQVGDRFVHQLLKAHAGNLGGEASGHVLCLHKASTGDAIVTALQVLDALESNGLDLAQSLRGVKRVPQKMINVRIKPGSVPLTSAIVTDTLALVERQLGEQGRVILRASGTEPLIRVTLEGVDAAQVERLAEQLAQAVRAAAEM